MRCLVTGGAGFIGSNLVDKLVSLGADVVCVDDESSDSEHSWSSTGIGTRDNHKIDICELLKCKYLFKNIDYVFHLAAESRIQNTIENPTKCVKTNSYGTSVVLQCAKENNVKRVVFSSTSAVYGNNSSPNSEDQITDCLNPYSVSKLNGEHLCKIYNDIFGLETVVLRYFNVYGNRQPSKGQYAPVMGIFNRQKKSNQKLTVVGDGLQKRDFVNVTDVVEANLLAAKRNIPKRLLGTSFNIGSGVNYSILEIAKKISDDIEFLPKRIGEMQETLANIKKAEEILGWTPKINLNEYLQQQ